MIDIILIEPENSGNIGAIARVMKNFGFVNLVLINPVGEINKTAMDRACHAKDVLKKAKIRTNRVLKNYDYLVGTTAKLGNDYNIPRCPVYPEELRDKIMRPRNKKRKMGLVFGREGKGLFNSEIEKMDFLVTIPTSKIYPVMNLSHSVSVILYELSKQDSDNIKKVGDNIPPITKKEKEILL